MKALNPLPRTDNGPLSSVDPNVRGPIRQHFGYVAQSDRLNAFGRSDFDFDIRQAGDLAAINAHEVRMFAAGVLLAPHFESPGMVASDQSGQDAGIGHLD